MAPLFYLQSSRRFSAYPDRNRRNSIMIIVLKPECSKEQLEHFTQSITRNHNVKVNTWSVRRAPYWV